MMGKSAGKKRIAPVRVVLLLGLGGVLLVVGSFAGCAALNRGMTGLPTGEVIPGVVCVASSSGSVHANSYLLKGEGGYLMVDAGIDQDQVSEGLTSMGIAADEVKAILLTHSDGDHLAALPLFESAEIYLPADEVAMIDGTTGRGMLGVNLFPFMHNTLDHPYRTIGDGETIELVGFSVKGIATPGHTPGSMCFQVDDTFLFTGDNLRLVAGRAVLFNTFYNMDNAKQRASLTALAHDIQAGDIAARYAFTSHQGYCADLGFAFEPWLVADE